MRDGVDEEPRRQGRPDVRALRDLVDERGSHGDDTPVAPLPSRRELRTDQAMTPRDAFFSRTEKR
jgi:hypothetical protein